MRMRFTRAVVEDRGEMPEDDSCLYLQLGSESCSEMWGEDWGLFVKSDEGTETLYPWSHVSWAERP